MNKKQRAKRNNKIIRMSEQGHTVEEIMVKFRLSRTTVYDIVGSTLLTQKTLRDEKIISLHNDGLNYIEIAKIVGCHRVTVSRVIEKHYKESCWY